MGIVLHDVNEYIMELSVPGTQAVADHVQANLVPFPGTIRAIFARLDTAGTTNAQTTDILLNGTTIFATTLLSFATTARKPTYGALAVNPTVVAKGDTLRLNTTAVHDTPGKSLVVFVTIRRNHASPYKTADTDSISQMSDSM